LLAADADQRFALCFDLTAADGQAERAVARIADAAQIVFAGKVAIPEALPV
jgi:hypothetical protein